jgi:serine/threonine protein kinase
MFSLTPYSHSHFLITLSVWGLPRVEVELGETLGRGEFGEVCLATYRDMELAAKVIHEDKQNASNTASFLHEAAILT